MPSRIRRGPDPTRQLAGRIYRSGGGDDSFIDHLRPLISRADDIAVVATFIQDNGPRPLCPKISGRRRNGRRRYLLRAGLRRPGRLTSRPGPSGELDAVCAVDILNEGIDIPRIDRVVMLRPTESPVVFMQQLGRGLRRAEDKDHLIAELRARQIEPRGPNIIPFPRPGHVIAFPTIEAAAGAHRRPQSEPPASRRPLCRGISTVHARPSGARRKS